MRRNLVALTTAGVLCLTGLAACSDDDTGSDAAVPQRGGDGTGRVGVILPDKTSSQRWGTDDPELLSAAFKAADVPVDITNADGDSEKFKQLGDQLIANGATVLILASVDSVSGKYVIDKAHAAGVRTIDYDRLTLNGDADYYVSFDNVAVGKLLGQGMETCLTRAKNKKKANGEPVIEEGQTPRIVYLNGAPTDNNATQFKTGYDSVLGPAYDKGTYLKGPDQSVEEWDPETGKAVFVEMFNQYASQGGIQGVLAANDGLGAAAIEALSDRQQNGIPVTGQDASVEGLQNILAGDQCMTVYKPLADEAKAAADLAISIFKGQEVKTDEQVKDPESGGYIDAVLLKPQSIFKGQIKKVIADGAADKDQVCAGRFKQYCPGAGIE